MPTITDTRQPCLIFDDEVTMGLRLLAVSDLSGGGGALPAGAATSAKQDALLAELQLKADLTETQPVSLSTLPALVAGAAVVGKVGIDQSTPGTTNRVTLGADSVAVTSSSFATSAKQDTLQTAIDAINTKVPALGQALAAGSTPVVLTAAQLSTLTPPAAIAGFALEAGHLAAIDTSTAKIPALGQALAAGSVPVVLTAIQQAALTPPAAITGYALESTQLLQATEATLATLAITPGTLSADQVGPLMQALVNDSPTSYATETVQPLSMTNQGRLRVSTVAADVTQVWQHTFESPWSDDNPWQMESPYV